VSGFAHYQSLEFELVDHNDQVINIDNTSLITVKSIINNTSVLGTSAVKVNNGVASFDHLIFVAKPGLK
jgi:hypothetical protein